MCIPPSILIFRHTYREQTPLTQAKKGQAINIGIIGTGVVGETIAAKLRVLEGRLHFVYIQPIATEIRYDHG